MVQATYDRLELLVFAGTHKIARYYINKAITMVKKLYNIAIRNAWSRVQL